MLRPLDAVLRRCAKGVAHSGVASTQPSDPLASPPEHQSPVGFAKVESWSPGTGRCNGEGNGRPILRPHFANEIGRCRSSESIVSTGVSRQERMGDLEVRTLRTPACATNNDTHHASGAACYGRRVYHECVTVASRRCTRIILGYGGLDDGSSVPSLWTLSTGSTKRMWEGYVRDLGVKQIVTDGARGRRAATGGSATLMFNIRRRTGRPTCLNHGACRPTPSARRRRTLVAHRQRQPELGAGIDDSPGNEVRVLGAKEQSWMRGEDVTLPLEVSATLALSEGQRTGCLIFPRFPFPMKWSMPPDAGCATTPVARCTPPSRAQTQRPSGDSFMPCGGRLGGEGVLSASCHEHSASDLANTGVYASSMPAVMSSARRRARATRASNVLRFPRPWRQT
jgi:hypothetical protein